MLFYFIKHHKKKYIEILYVETLLIKWSSMVYQKPYLSHTLTNHI